MNLEYNGIYKNTKHARREHNMADLFHRVSIRTFQNKEIEDSEINYILKAAMAAPSARNQQPWEFYVTRNPQLRRDLSEVSPYAGPVKNAPVVIVATYHKDCQIPDYAQIDLSIAMENLWLAADEIGLGGVWIGIAPIPERMEHVARIIQLPSDQCAFALFALGHPAETRAQENRFDPAKIHRI